jgi:hypothetical protein
VIEIATGQSLPRKGGVPRDDKGVIGPLFFFDDIWLVASEHLYNINDIRLNIYSDTLCDISMEKK